MESTHTINLRNLKITTYVYDKISGYDESYSKVMDLTGDFSQTNQMESLFQFLRDWGCRQFKTSSDNDRIKSFTFWFNQHGSILQDHKASLLQIDDKEIQSFGPAIQSLMDCHASWRKGKQVRFGPVGASKALLVLRKDIFAPWDNPIIDGLNERNIGTRFTKDGKGYCEYLIYVKNQLQILEKEMGKNKIDELPKLVIRPNSSLPKLIDEHLWVSITGRIDPNEIISLIR